MDKLYIVIPAYNEEENIEAVIKDWYPIVEKIGNGSRLVIIMTEAGIPLIRLSGRRPKSLRRWKPSPNRTGVMGIQFYTAINML